MLKITLTKSPIGNTPKNRRTVKALGLGKMNSSVIQEDTKPIRGMIHAIQHLVTVEEIEGAEKVRKRRGKKAGVAEVTQKATAKPAKKAAPAKEETQAEPAAEAKPAEKKAAAPKKKAPAKSGEKKTAGTTAKKKAAPKAKTGEPKE